MKAPIEQLLEQLGRKADRFGIDSLSEGEQTVLVPWWTLGVVGNGGFRYFMQFASKGLSDASRRFRALGLEAVADALDQACEILNLRGKEPLDEAARWQLVHFADWSKLRDAELVLYRLDFDRLKSAIQAYAEQNRLLGPLN